MKKAIAVIIFLVLTLVFGFVAIGCQITVPVKTEQVITEPATEPIADEELVEVHTHNFNEENMCECGAVVTVKQIAFNEWLLSLVKVQLNTLVEFIIRIASIALFALSALILGIALGHKFIRKDRAPRAPRRRKRVENTYSAEVIDNSSNEIVERPRVRF